MRRAKSGLYTGSKKGPLGYSYDPDTNSLIPVPEEAETVHLIFELFTERKWGVDKIVSYFNEKGISTKTGAKWHKSNVGRIIRNSVYIDKIHWNDEDFDGSHSF